MFFNLTHCYLITNVLNGQRRIRVPFCLIFLIPLDLSFIKFVNFRRFETVSYVLNFSSESILLWIFLASMSVL